MNAQGKHAYQILVVDDEPLVCRAIMMLLKHDGHVVETVESGEKALGVYAPGKFDLIITDYSMRDMKGDELAAFIKKHHPEQRIIMASAFAETLKAEGKLKGTVDFLLNKPFSMAELRDAVANVMDN